MRKKGRKQKTRLRICFSILVIALILVVVEYFALFYDWSGKEKELAEATESEVSPALETETEEAIVVETETEEKGPEIKTVTISAVGDNTFGPTHTHGYAGSFHEYYDNYGLDYFYSGVRDIFQADDFTVADLECALTNEEAHMDKEFCLKGKPEYAALLPNASIEGVAMANNHTWDYGDTGLQETKDAVTSVGVAYAYFGENPIYTTEDGITIGWVSSSFLSYGADREEYMRSGIEDLRSKGVDLVIAFAHWGIERTNYPEDYQINMAHNCIDWGADVVVACHPHVIQGSEVYKGRVIMYSMGNFCYGGHSNPPDKDTFIFQQTFTFVDGVLQQDIDARIIPCTVSSTTACNDYQPTVATGDKKAEIIARMNEYSAPYSQTSFDADGKLIYSGQ